MHPAKAKKGAGDAVDGTVAAFPMPGKKMKNALGGSTGDDDGYDEWGVAELHDSAGELARDLRLLLQRMCRVSLTGLRPLSGAEVLDRFGSYFRAG